MHQKIDWIFQGRELMDYFENVDRSSELTRMVLPMLSRLKILVNPISYALWYEYYLGRHEALNIELDRINNGSEPYEAKKAEALFLRYVINPDIERMENIGNEVRRLLSEITEVVSVAGNDTTAYGDFLDKSTGQLVENNELSSVKQAVRSLLSKTNDMLAVNKKFETQLHSSTQEMHLLREELSDIRQKASMDPLTGLANRGEFDEALESAVGKGSAGESKIWLMMVDIDKFKEINDQHGHLIGDRILKFVAAIFKKMLKGKDMVARYGGDEFSVILDDTPKSGAMILAENIRAAIETSVLKRTDTNVSLGKITISVGIAGLQVNDSTERFIDRADKALYHSKSSGRNHVACFGDF
jgi:diguanylate cyclase